MQKFIPAKILVMSAVCEKFYSNQQFGESFNMRMHSGGTPYNIIRYILVKFALKTFFYNGDLTKQILWTHTSEMSYSCT